jgi:ribosome-associated protein
MTVSESSLRINAQLAIPRREILFSFVRSSGPGGQNVNKVASKAVLRWSPSASTALPDGVRQRLLVQCGRRVNERGELVLSSQRYRDQAKNVGDCLDKLRRLVAAAAVAPKKRKKTRIPKGVKESRLRQKRATSEKKRSRGRSSFDE